MDLSVQNDDNVVLCGFDCFVEKNGALIGSFSNQMILHSIFFFISLCGAYFNIVIFNVICNFVINNHFENLFSDKKTMTNYTVGAVLQY